MVAQKLIGKKKIPGLPELGWKPGFLPGPENMAPVTALNSTLINLRPKKIFRVLMWDWMVLTIQGSEQGHPLFYSHLLAKADRYDVNQLYKLVTDFLEAENFLVFGQKIEEFSTCTQRRGKTFFHFLPGRTWPGRWGRRLKSQNFY